LQDHTQHATVKNNRIAIPVLVTLSIAITAILQYQQPCHNYSSVNKFQVLAGKCEKQNCINVKNTVADSNSK